MRLTLLLLLACADEALASGLPADIELVHPTTANAPVGVEMAQRSDLERLEIGLLTQYERNPLVLKLPLGGEAAVVPERYAADLVVSGALIRRLGFRLVVPAMSQWGTESIWGADGTALGDIRLGIRGVLADGEHLVVGVRGDVVLPTGASDAWLGELNPRLVVGGFATWYGGRWAWTLDGAIQARSVVRTGADLDIGPEFATAAGARWSVGPALDLHGSVVSRTGLFRQGRGTVALEALTGVTWRPVDMLSLVLGLGHGLTSGYGTTDLRVITGVAWRLPEKRVVATPEIRVSQYDDLPEAEPEIIVVTITNPEPDGWAEGELARVTDQRIEIREPIHFELGTERILEPSLPLLGQVAALLAERPEILQVVIVGHASDEGSFAYNYDLSLRRARSVFEALVTRGVHPDRLSFRGMGEVQPDAAVAVEAQRRVEFRIVAVRRPDEPALPLPDAPPLPWSGEAQETQP